MVSFLPVPSCPPFFLRAQTEKAGKLQDVYENTLKDECIECFKRDLIKGLRGIEAPVMYLLYTFGIYTVWKSFITSMWKLSGWKKKGKAKAGIETSIYKEYPCMRKCTWKSHDKNMKKSLK